MEAVKMTYKDADLITRDEFMEQVYSIEGVRVALRDDEVGLLVKDIVNRYGVSADVYVTPYPYTERMSGELTVSDLIKDRVYPHVSMNSVIIITGYKFLLQQERIIRMDATELMKKLNGIFCQITTTNGIKVVDKDFNEITEIIFDYEHDKLIIKQERR